MKTNRLCILNRYSSSVAALIFTFTWRSGSAEANWPRWRGPEDQGSALEGNYPTSWEPGKVLWKSALPGIGCSTPIVWNRRIYLTTPSDNQDAVLAFDWSGRPLWKTPLGPENPGKHRNGSGSNPSPVTDGQGIFVYFKSGNLAALSFDGKVTWKTNLVERFGPDTLFWDHGTSPVLTEKFAIMTRMHHGESWVAAFDRSNGEIRWKVARNYQTPTEGDHGYTTPIVIRHQGKEALLVWGGQHLTAHDAADGNVLWTCGDFNPDSAGFWPAVASPVIAGEMVVVPFGRADRGEPRLHGIQLGGKGDVTKTHRKWLREDAGTFVPTPAAYQGKVFILGDRGQVNCLDPASGKTLWSGSLPRSRSNYYSSPVLAGGKLYAVREDGVVFVAGIDGELKVLSQIDMQERVIASIVPVSNRLLIRGEKHLFCVGEPEESGQ
jgi:outer membrane protein assembly factor BamB